MKFNQKYKHTILFNNLSLFLVDKDIDKKEDRSYSIKKKFVLKIDKTILISGCSSQIYSNL